MLSRKPTLAVVKSFALDVRLFLDDRWEGLGTTSASKCIVTSLFLTKLLTAEVGGHWQVVCGTYRAPGSRRRGDHSWVRERQTGICVDLTADQFGLAPVIVCSRGKYPGTERHLLWESLEHHWAKELHPLESAYTSYLEVGVGSFELAA